MDERRRWWGRRGQPALQMTIQTPPKSMVTAEQGGPAKGKRKRNRGRMGSVKSKTRIRPNQKQATNTAVQARGNYARVATGSLLMGVADMGCGKGRVTMGKRQLTLFKPSLLKALDSLPDNAGDIGVSGITLEDGFITVKCVNQNAVCNVAPECTAPAHNYSF